MINNSQDHGINKINKKEFEQLLEQCKKYAKDNGIHVNPDQKVVNHLIRALLEREKRLGKKYCPCRYVKKDNMENDKIVCPCVYCKEEVEKDGHCQCFLFVK